MSPLTILSLKKYVLVQKKIVCKRPVTIKTTIQYTFKWLKIGDYILLISELPFLLHI